MIDVINPHHVVGAAVQAVQADLSVEFERGVVVELSPFDRPVRDPNGGETVAAGRVVPFDGNRR